MRRLMLLRHAKSDSPEGVSDHDRPLAARGQRQSKEMGRYLFGQGLVPDLAVVSTARRAQETWRLASTALAKEVAQRSEPRLYEATSDDILQIITEADPGVHVLLLVGHNPGFERLATGLAGTGRSTALSRLGREYPTAALAVIDFAVDSWTDVAMAGGYLDRFETLASISS